MTLKAGSSEMLMLDTPVASGIHVGSMFSGFGSMLETLKKDCYKSNRKFGSILETFMKDYYKSNRKFNKVMLET